MDDLKYQMRKKNIKIFAKAGIWEEFREVL